MAVFIGDNLVGMSGRAAFILSGSNLPPIVDRDDGRSWRRISRDPVTSTVDPRERQVTPAPESRQVRRARQRKGRG